MNETVDEAEGVEGKIEHPEPSRKKRSGGAFTATLVALIAIAGVLYLYQQQLFLKRDVTALQQGLGKILSLVEQNHSDTLDRLKTVPEHNHPQLTNRVQQAEQLLADTRMRIGQDRHAWALAEAEYLLRIADHDLRFKHNTITAIAALKTARERLEAEDRQTFSDPIRRIDADINALSLVQLPDREALAEKLATLVSKTEALPLLRQEKSPSQAVETDKPAEEERSGWDKIWHDLGNLVTIRHEDEVVAKPMLPPEQRYFLRRNLQLKLESARLALLLDNTTAWKASLDEAAAWTKHYFDDKEPAVKETLDALEHLGTIQLLPPLPDLGTTRSLLQKLARQAANIPPATSKPKVAKPVRAKPSTRKPTPTPVKKTPETTKPAAPAKDKPDTTPEPAKDSASTAPAESEAKGENQ